MKASELINTLTAMVELAGDADICAQYDGGYIADIKAVQYDQEENMYMTLEDIPDESK